MKKLVFCCVLACILFIATGCGKEAQVKTILSFEVNTEVRLKDLITPDEDIKVVNGTDLVDTSVLGEKEIVIKYYVNDKEKYTTAKIKVVDTTPPVIEASKTKITVIKGKTANLLDGVKVKDNSNEEIKASVEGVYDTNKVGEYNLKYIAVDSSGNRAEKDVVLAVKNVSIRTSGYYVYKGSDVWIGIAFKSNKNVIMEYNYCPKATMEGYGCGGYQERGTYKVDNNKITITISIAYTDTGTDKSVKGDKVNCTISSETKIVCNKYTFNWKNKFA